MNKEIEEIKEILVEWDPLGDDKSQVPNFDYYETEAVDISDELDMFAENKKSAIKIVKETIEQAFDIDLNYDDVIEPGNQIWQIHRKFKG